MRIVLATSEAAPFAKTGGLADVCSARCRLNWTGMGQHVAVIMPAYREVHQAGLPIKPTGIELTIPIGRKTVRGKLLQGRFPDSDVPVYFVEQADYFDRDELYQVAGKDYPDNCERFIFFSRAVMEAVRLLELDVDILHANDWQTGLVPAYHKIEYRNVPQFERSASLMTVHNLSYQGTFWHWDMLLTGLDWKYFNWHQMEFFGQLNLLKTGLVFADAINTVSPRYAEEIQSAPLGAGLEGVLQQRRAVLSGIINGVDYSQWNPETDPNLPAKYRSFQCSRRKGQVPRRIAARIRLAARQRRSTVGGVHWPADGTKRHRLDYGGDSGMGANQQSCSGRSWAPASRSIANNCKRWPSAIRKKWPCGWSSPSAWRICTKPGPTCS